jgi:hypothetical protein
MGMVRCGTNRRCPYDPVRIRRRSPFTAQVGASHIAVASRVGCAWGINLHHRSGRGGLFSGGYRPSANRFRTPCTAQANSNARDRPWVRLPLSTQRVGSEVRCGETSSASKCSTLTCRPVSGLPHWCIESEDVFPEPLQRNLMIHPAATKHSP